MPDLIILAGGAIMALIGTIYHRISVRMTKLEDGKVDKDMCELQQEHVNASLERIEKSQGMLLNHLLPGRGEK